MKIILSRKGFDSSWGGYASPILSTMDNRMISIPIPEGEHSSGIKYSELHMGEDKTYFDIMDELYNGKIKINGKTDKLTCCSGCHLDPDINRDVKVRGKEWKPVFGQIGSSQTHLENNNIQVGDIFLFFGWFRNTIERNGKLVFDPKDHGGRHVIYGYMQVGDINRIETITTVPEWMEYHPHCCTTRRQKPNNTIYVATNKLTYLNDTPGAGAFKKYDISLCLTKKGYTRSKWDLPDIFKNVSISHHTKKSWKENYFQSAMIGQEFVIDANDKIKEWAINLIETNTNRDGGMMYAKKCQ